MGLAYTIFYAPGTRSTHCTFDRARDILKRGLKGKKKAGNEDEGIRSKPDAARRKKGVLACRDHAVTKESTGLGDMQENKAGNESGRKALTSRSRSEDGIEKITGGHVGGHLIRTRSRGGTK